MTTYKPSHLVPKLRFPKFEGAGDWEEKQLSSLVKLVSGVHLAPDMYSTTGEVPYFTGPSDFTDAIQCVAKWTAESVNIAKQHDTLITVKGSGVGKIWYLTLPSIAMGRQLMAVRTEVGDRRFIYQFLSTRRAQFEALASGNLIPGLSRGDILGMAAYFPSRDEQKKISDCLGSLDDLIAAEGRQLEALRQHKQGLMQQLFPQPGETVPRLRFPEFQDAPDWKTGRCRDIAKVLPGYGFPDKFQGNKKGQYPFYKVSDISHTIEKGQRYISEANNYIDSDVLDKIRGKFVPAGTIIFAKIGEAIRSNRRVITTKPAVIDNNTAGVKAMNGKSSDEFLFYLWSNVSLIDHAGGVVPAVRKSALENVPLCYPSDPAEQQRIADCLSAVSTRIGAQMGKLDTLRTHKQGLMQQLFPSLEGH